MHYSSMKLITDITVTMYMLLRHLIPVTLFKTKIIVLIHVLNTAKKVFLTCFVFLKMSTSSSSTEEEQIISLVSMMAMNKDLGARNWRGRLRGSRPNISRGPCSWYRDYLNAQPIYYCSHFRRRFRIPISLFRKFERELPDVEPYLRQKHDSVGHPGAAP